MAKVAIELVGTEPHALVDQITSLYTQWNMARQPWLTRVREVIQYVYATSTRETSNVTNPWSHSTVVPKLTQIHDNLGANYANALFGKREFFTFEAATEAEADKKKRLAVVNYLSTKHDYNGFRATVKKLLDDWVQCGNCFCRVEYVREVEKDPVTNAEFVTYEGPKVFRISPYDIVFDIAVAEFKDSPKIIRELITRGELMRRIESPEGADYDASEVEKLKKFYGAIGAMTDKDINKNIQMTMDGFSNSSDFFRSGRVELLHFIGDIYDVSTGELHKSRLITVVDRRCILQNRAQKDIQGFGKIYHAAWRKRTDNLMGQGPLDNLVGMQYLINHLENARADGFDQMLSPDRVHIGAVEVERVGPVKNYYVDAAGGGDVRNLSPDPTVLNADTQIQLKEAQMEAYAGAPREAMGIRSPGEKTAFEIRSLQNAAGRLFQTKIEDFEIELLEPVLNGELEVSYHNLNTSDVAKTLDEDFGTTEFMTITREDLQARGKLKARGSSHYAKRAMMVQELQAFSGIVAQDPRLQMHFPSKKMAEVWNETLGFEALGLYQPFGGIYEQIEQANATAVAQQKMAEFQSALTGVEDAGIAEAQPAT